MKMYDMVLWLTMRGNAIISGLSVLFTFSFLTAPKRMNLKDPVQKKVRQEAPYFGEPVSQDFCWEAPR
jgi:hypothetical protein